MLPVPGDRSLPISIGSIPLTLHSPNEELLGRAARRYGPFVSAKPAGLPVFLDAALPPESSAEFTCRLDGASLWLGSSTARFGNVQHEFALDSLLRILLTRLLLPRTGFLLHAATVVRDSKAYVFTGRSGAGKSTIAALAPAGSVLTDEISLLQMKDGEWRAFGTPFWGEFRAAGQNREVPLAGFFALEQAKENRVTALGTKEALQALLPNLLYFAGSDPASEKLLVVLMQAVTTVPVYRLAFRRDTAFWEILP